MREKNRLIWNNIFKKKYENNSYNKYPTEHIVVFMAVNYFKMNERKKIKVLEIGCGSGCNLVFLANEGFNTYGIDHSDYAINMSEKFLNMNNCKAQVYNDYASQLSFDNDFFDVCVESNTIHCNKMNEIKKIFDEIYRVLKKDGMFFGILASDVSAEYGKGKLLEQGSFDFMEVKTFRGQFDGFPVIHFFSKEEILKLTEKFADCKLELDVSTFENNTPQSPLGYWLVTLKK